MFGRATITLGIGPHSSFIGELRHLGHARQRNVGNWALLNAKSYE